MRTFAPHKCKKFRLFPRNGRCPFPTLRCITFSLLQASGGRVLGDPHTELPPDGGRDVEDAIPYKNNLTIS